MKNLINNNSTYIEEHSKKLENLWRNEIKIDFKSPKAIKARKNYNIFNKENYPVIISNTIGIDYFSKETYQYGEIDFSKAGCGWTDSTIFHFVPEGSHSFFRNTVGKKVNIRYSRGGGSAFYEFDYTPENIEIVTKLLINSGYKVESITKKSCKI